MLGDIHCRTTILAAESQALQHADNDQNNGSEPTGRLVGGQEANQRGCTAHDTQGDEKSVFAADDVTDASEEERAERAYQEANRESCQICDISEGVVAGRIEFQRQNGGEASEDVEVV